MTSYRSNRFNCFFLSAAAIIYHLQDLRAFFGEGYLAHCNNKMESVALDILDETLMSFVCAVALLYIHVTGPFWNLLNSNVKYLNFYTYIQKMEAYFLGWREDASDLLSPVFAGMLDGEFLLQSDLKQAVVQFAAEHPKVQPALETIMRDFVTVSRLQLADFLEGGKFAGAQPPDIQAALDHCPLTNLLGENVFGELDFDMNKRRHASFHHRSSLQMIGYNKTPSWLAEKSEEEREKLMQEARQKSRALRQSHRRQEQIVRLTIRERLLDNRRKKRLKEAQAAEKRSALIRTVLAHSGPCQNQADVAKLIRRLRRAGVSNAKIKLHLKDEIRFQKLVVNKKGSLKLMGSLDELQRSLEDHLITPGAVSRGDCLVDLAAAVPAESEGHYPVLHPDGDDDVDHWPAPDDETDADEVTRFQFTAQGQWVAVYFVDKFYIGQVLEVKEDGSKASVQYLEQTKGRKDYFRWPSREDVVENTHAEDVFKWNFECLPVSNDGRIWGIADVDAIHAAYARVSSQF